MGRKWDFPGVFRPQRGLNMLKKNLKAFILLNILLWGVFFTIPAFAETVKATETEISLVDGIAVDKKGNIRFALFGSVDWNDAKITSVLERLMNE